MARDAGNVLLVEGKNDAIVFATLCAHHGIRVWTEDEPSVLKQSGLQHLGVVVDCDPDKGMRVRWQQLFNLAKNAGYDVPKTPAQQGTILVREGRPALGIWLMPDNKGDGFLEDFVGFLVSPGDAMWEWADKCLDLVPECPSRFKPSHRAKARIHSWLAWQEEPGTPMGSAITQRYLDAHAAHALRFFAWLRLLFESNCVAARGPLSEAEAG